jgi:P27 family predicted phage terminase small subunit
VEATRTVTREGITTEVVTVSASGAETRRTVPHPAVTIARSAGRELRAFAAQFGLTPSSEQALARGADDGSEDDNPFA